MRNAVRLGRVFGIEIGLDYSWFIIFALVTWTLAAHYFPMNYRWPAATYWTVGLITSLIFFASVLAHELGHSVVALRFGIPVHSIRLFIFGGLAQISHEPKRAREEFYIAIAGPSVSVALAGLFWVFSRAVYPKSPLEALGTWLAVINLSIAAFNLIPGFPLDGGRVFRAAVWGLTGSYTRATRIAAGLGQVVAYGFIALGVWMAVAGALWNGLWIGFIGWFLLNASTTSFKQVSVQEMLQGLTAQEVMMTDCPQVPRELTLEALVRDHVLRTARQSFPVVEDGYTWGIVTLKEIKAVPKARWAQVTVGEIMVPFEQIVKVPPQTGLAEVLQQMAEQEVNQLPVVEGDQLLGMISRDGILQLLKTRAELRV